MSATTEAVSPGSGNLRRGWGVGGGGGQHEPKSHAGADDRGEIKKAL